MLDQRVDPAPARRPVPGATNLRDLGGHRTASGATVKWRMLYRSNELSKLNDEDVAAFAATGIRSICDLRHDDERRAAPTRVPAEKAPQIHLMPIRSRIPGAATLSSAAATGDDVRQALRAIYRHFVLDHAAAYRQLFDRLVEAEHYPLVFHCSAGKDRTGVAATLILAALGVPREVILEEYLLTNDHWRAPDHLLPNLTGEARKAVIEAHPDYLGAAYEAIDAAFGSLGRYLEDAMGLTPDRRQRLMSALLDPAL